MTQIDDDDGRIVEGEVVANLPQKSKPTARAKSFFHPASGIAILAVDWLAFGADLVTGFALLALMSIVAFTFTFIAVRHIQIRYAGDDKRAAGFKAFLGAFAAGVPFPISGTIVGAVILMLSGLPHNWRQKKG